MGSSPWKFKPQTGHTSPGVQEEETLAAGGTAGTDECNGKASTLLEECVNAGLPMKRVERALHLQWLLPCHCP